MLLLTMGFLGVFCSLKKLNFLVNFVWDWLLVDLLAYRVLNCASGDFLFSGLFSFSCCFNESNLSVSIVFDIGEFKLFIKLFLVKEFILLLP